MVDLRQSSGWRPAVWALVLLAGGLGMLWAGGFVQFGDTSGFGSDQWILPVGIAASVPVLGALAVARRDITARLWLGVACAVLVVCLALVSAGNDGFRFVWHSDEGEFRLLAIVLGLVAAVLIATGLQPSSRNAKAGRWLVRVAFYLCGTFLLMYVAFGLGIAHFEATECKDSTGDCDLAGLEGLVWSVIALPVSVVAVLVIELVLHRRRKQRREANR
jgi:uncharacterized membrane protein